MGKRARLKNIKKSLLELKTLLGNRALLDEGDFSDCLGNGVFTECSSTFWRNFVRQGIVDLREQKRLLELELDN